MTPHLPIGNSRDQIVGPKPIVCTCNLSQKKKNLNPLRTGKNKVIIISSKLVFISSIYNYLKKFKTKTFRAPLKLLSFNEFFYLQKIKNKIKLELIHDHWNFLEFFYLILKLKPIQKILI